MSGPREKQVRRLQRTIRNQKASPGRLLEREGKADFSHRHQEAGASSRQREDSTLRGDGVGGQRWVCAWRRHPGLYKGRDQGAGEREPRSPARLPPGALLPKRCHHSETPQDTAKAR